MPRLNKRLAIIGLCFLLGATGIALLWALSYKLNSNHRGESHAIARTRMDIQNASIAIKFYAINKNKIPQPLLLPTERAKDAKELYNILFDEEKNISYVPSHWRDKKTIVDRWGNPLNFDTHLTKPQTFEIFIWSNGPNEANDAGAGDDISINRFDIEIGGPNK